MGATGAKHDQQDGSVVGRREIIFTVIPPADSWAARSTISRAQIVDADGKPFFDGFLIDDAGSGLWLPKLVVDNKDSLFTTDEDRRRFAKQIDITHMLYAGDTGDFLQNKRENARLLREKGSRRQASRL